MPSLDDALLEWAVSAAAPGAEVVEVRGLRDGGSPWLLRLRVDGREPGVAERGVVERGVVLRVGPDPAPLHTEVAALRLAQRHGVPAPRVVATALDDDPPALLAEQIAGSSAIPADRPVARLRALGAAAAALHAIPLAPGPALPRRDRPIPGADFAALRREQPTELLTEAERAIADRPVPGAEVFVHGDLWQGNALWDGDDLVGLVDWDCAGAGPAGIDIGSLRCDAALCHGVDAATDVLDGWQDAAGRAAEDVAYWDVVAALCTPPDMDWFVGAIAGQGRPDLDQPTLLRRRDAFLRAALHRLTADLPGRPPR